MPVTPTLLYRGTLTGSSATLATTAAGATTVLTSIVLVNTHTASETVTLTIGGVAVVSAMPVAPSQTVSIDIKQVVPAGTVIAGLASNASRVAAHISGAVVA